MPRKPKKTAKPVNDADVIDLARREAAELLGFDFDRMDAGARLECDTDPDTDEPSIQRLRRFATATLETRACLLRLMSHAWPRLMPCFDGEASEVLMHPLATAFNVGDNHANHLSSGHALWGARTGVRWQKFNRVSQPRNNAGAQSLVNSLSIPGKRYPISACRHKVIRAPSVRLRLRIRILSQVSGGQEPKYERCSGVASRASQGVPSSPSTSTLARPRTAGRIDHIIRNWRREGGQRRPPAKEWLHEIKHDSFRAIAHKDGAPRRRRLSAAPVRYRAEIRLRGKPDIDQTSPNDRV